MPCVHTAGSLFDITSSCDSSGLPDPFPPRPRRSAVSARGVPPEPVIVVLGPFEGSGSPGWDRRVLWVLLAVMNL